MYKAFLIDLDGTAYLGNNVIKQTVEFVKKCKKNNIKVLFLTNNASATSQQIYNKLTKMGYEISLEEIFTSAMAMAEFLENKKIKDKVYLIGDDGLRDSLANKNITFATNLNFENEEHINKIKDYNSVVVGYNKHLTYSDLAIASVILQKNDSNLFATNLDMKIPSHLGILPGNGSIVNLLENTTDKKAISVGKPNKIIMNLALKKLNCHKEEVCMIGDNYKTDILAGILNGIDTIFVETGVNTIEEVQKEKLKPTYLLKDLSQYDI